LGTHLREGIETASGLEMTSLFGRIRISLRFGFHTAKKTRRVQLKSKPNKEVSVEPFFFGFWVQFQALSVALKVTVVGAVGGHCDREACRWRFMGEVMV
jgi:hypothetical protein